MAQPYFFPIPHSGGRKLWIHAGEPASGMKQGDILSDTTAGLIKYYSGSAWSAGTTTIADEAVTVAKMADLARGSILVGTTASNRPAALDAKADGKILIGDGTDLKSVAVTGDIGITNAGVTAITADSIVNADVKTNAAIAWSKMAALASAHLLVGNGSNVATDVAVSGVIAMANNGATSFAAGAIVNADVNAAAAIAESKIAFSVAGHDHDGINSKLVSVGTADHLANNVVCEAGGTDYTIDFGAAGGAYTLTVPAVGGHRTFAFINEAQAFSAAQTFINSGIHILDTNASHDLILAVGSDLTGDHTLTFTTGDADRSITLGGNVSFAGAVTLAGAWTHVGAHTVELTTSGATTVTLPTTGTLATLAGAETLTTKTLTDASCVFGANGALTKTLGFDLSALTAGNKLTLAAAAGTAQTLTLPNATDTLVGKATTDVFTNKSFDCDGAGNALTNVNMTELDPIGDGACGITFVYQKAVANIAAAGTNITATNPKMRVIDAWFVSTSGDTGTVAVHVGQVGSIGAAVVAAMTIPADDCQVTRADEIDDAAWDVAENAGLVAVGDGGASVDGVIFVECMRIN